MLSLKDEMQTYCEFEESEDLQTYDECTAQYWETYDGFFGIIFTILVLGLLAACVFWTLMGLFVSRF